MKNRLAAVLMGVLLSASLSACGTTIEETGAAPETDAAAEATSENVAETSPTETPTDGTEEESQVVSGGSPWIDSTMPGNLSADMELSAKDDFHLYVNHDWMLQNVIPEGRSTYSSFSEVADGTDKKALELLNDDSLTGHDAELIRTYYHAIMDWDARNAAGITPIEGTVEDIRGLDSLEAMTEFICDEERSMFVAALLSVGNTPSYDDSEHYITYINNDSLLLGDPAEYAERTEMGDRSYESKLGLTVTMLVRLGYTEEEAAAVFDDVIAFEAKLAEVSLTSADSMSPDIFEKINNVYTPEEMKHFSGNFPLDRILKAWQYDDAKSYLVYEPKVIDRINELYTEENLETIKNYMLVHFVTGIAAYLDEQAYDAYIEAWNLRYGATGREEYEKIAFDKVRSNLPTPMARAYLEKYDATEKKERITEICEEVIAVYREMLAGEDWLSEETRENAIEKLDAIRIHAVYPEKWIDYSSMDLEGLSLIECEKEISRFYYDIDRSYTNGTVDHDLWNFDILEANAYYDPQENSINLILGLLDAPFYYDGISDEALLGGIGAVIGHEISHAFDTSGAQFDKDGNFADWWTEEDYEAFTARAQKLVDYYDGITVWEGMNAQGNNVQTEAIADMAGMRAMLKIAEKKEGFDYDAFFKAYAAVWREVATREYEYYCNTQDPHPLSYLRTNVTLQQFDEFLEQYDIREGDNMYLAPEDRILVW